MTPLVSIIVPIYKVEPYLRRCLDSIVNQTYTNLEIILVDDGSPDGCPQICDEYAAKDERIVVIHKENGGLSDARNAGLDICKGEYISFVDSDDWVDERYIEILFDLLTKENADIAIGEIKKTNTFEQSLSFKANSFITYLPTETIKRMFAKTEASFIAAWGKIFRSGIFSDLRFPRSKIHEDEYVNYIWFSKSNKVVYTDTILYYYFSRSDSITGKDSPYDYEEIFNLQYHFFQKNNNESVLNILRIRYGWHLLYLYNKEYHSKNKNILKKQIIQHRKRRLSIKSIYNLGNFALWIFIHFPFFYIFFKKVQSKIL